MKKCPNCTLIKTELEFGKHAGRADGLQRTCKICEQEYRMKTRDRRNELTKIRRNWDKEDTNRQNREYYARNKQDIRTRDREKYKEYKEYRDRISTYGRKRKFKIKQEDYQTRLEIQNYRCAICNIAY